MESPSPDLTWSFVLRFLLSKLYEHVKNYLVSLAIFLILQTSQAQSYNFELLGTDSVEFYTKLDSAVKATPDFGYTKMDTALLVMQIFRSETLDSLMAAINEALEDFNPYEHIAAHLEGGWNVVAESENNEYYLLKPLRGDKYWVKKLDKAPNSEYYRSSLTLFKIDCKEGMLGIVQTTEYDTKGNVTYSSPTRDDIIVSMSYAIPDSVGEAFVNSACK